MLPFWYFCWYKGCCHRTKSDLFHFSLVFTLLKLDRDALRPLYSFLYAVVFLGLIRRWANDILFIKLTEILNRIWTQQRIYSKITFRRKILKILPELPRNFPKIPQSRIHCMLANRGASVSFITNAAWTILNFHKITYMGTWIKLAKPIEWIESESRHMF